jgi:hypothetical protein
LFKIEEISIICNNVTNYLELNQITNKELMNPKIRHNNNITESMWETSSTHNYNYNSFYDEVNKFMKLDELQRKTFWLTWAYTYYINDNQDVLTKAKMEYKKNEKNPSFRKRIVNNMLGKEQINKILQENNNDKFQNIVFIFSSFKERFLKNYKKNKTIYASKNNIEVKYDKKTKHDKNKQYTEQMTARIRNVLQVNNESIFSNLVIEFINYKSAFDEKQKRCT